MGRAQRPEGPQGGGEGYGRALHETVEPNPLPGAYGHSRSADRWRPHRLEPVQPGSGSGYPQRRARSPLATDRWCCEELDRGGGITDYRYDGYRHDGYPRDVNRRDRYGDGGYRYGEPRWDDRRMDGYRLDGYRRDRRYRDGYPPPTAGRPGDDRWNGSYGGTSRDRDPGGRYPPASDRYRQEPFDRYGRPSQGMAAEFGDYPTYDDRYREEGPPSRRAPATRRQADLPYDERFDYGSDDPPGASGSYFGRSRTDPAINPGTPANDQGFGPPRRYGEDQPWQYFRSRPWPSGTDADKNNTYTPPVDQRRGVYENSWQ